MQLLHGVIDSPDIPLNVSRSYLQSDSNVKKISSYITKKVADKLNSMFKENREDFEAKWEDIKVFMEYGMLSDEKFYDRASKFTLLKNTEGKYFTLEEYNDKVKENSDAKFTKITAKYGGDKQQQLFKAVYKVSGKSMKNDVYNTSYIISSKGKTVFIQLSTLDEINFDPYLDKIILK